MNAAIVTWLVLRVARWLFWIALIAYSMHFFAFRERHIDAYGHLFLTTELTIFGLTQAAVFAGFLELMMREKAGIPRPTLTQWMPVSSPSNNNGTRSSGEAPGSEPSRA